MIKPSEKVKQIDIAQAIGVGRSTVSMILNGQEHKFSKELTERVRQTAFELGYTQQARSSKKTENTATDVIYCIKRKDLDSDHLPEFYTNIAFSLEKIFSRHGKTLILKNVDDVEELRDYIESRSDPIGGIILHGEFLSEKIALLRPDLPAVSILFRADWNSSAPLIELDNEGGVFSIASYLSSLGHDKVAYMGVIPRLCVFEQRLNGFLLAVRKLGLNEVIPFEEINKDMNSFFQAEQYAKLFFDCYEKAKTKPSAVICATSTMANCLINEAEKRDIQIPEDLSVTGFDDLTVSRQSSLQLTTIKTPINAICETAASLIVAAKKGVDIKGMTLKIPCATIVPGQSTSKIHHDNK
jgi:LacI family transcriptional regulator, galactose operon repressor